MRDLEREREKEREREREGGGGEDAEEIKASTYSNYYVSDKWHTFSHGSQ